MLISRLRKHSQFRIISIRFVDLHYIFMFTNLKRVFKFALENLSRNKGISIATIFVLVITIVLFTTLFFIHGISNNIISQIQSKIDIAAYFKSDVAEQSILNARDEILKNSPDIKNIQYVSKEDALDNFLQKHEGDAVLANALTQVGGNPFLPSLNITTTGDASQYEKINTILQGEQFIDLIDKVDYSQKKDIIDRVFSITSNINKFGLGLAIILVLVAILVVFNTIKLAIDSSKDEISTMRIVGASSWFVRAPFIIQGAIFGCISFIVCFLITILAAYFLSPGLVIILAGFSLWNYFLANLWLIILIQLGFGVTLGGAASFIVVQKYLKI